MTQAVFRGIVTASGRLKVEDRSRLAEYLQSQAGHPIELVFRKPKSQRSLDQNAYWWAVPVKILAEHAGYTDSQMHYALLGECFGYEFGPTGSPVPVKPSSSDLSVEEFNHLIEWVQTWAPSELGVVIPSPGEL